MAAHGGESGVGQASAGFRRCVSQLRSEWFLAHSVLIKFVLPQAAPLSLFLFGKSVSVAHSLET